MRELSPGATVGVSPDEIYERFYGDRVAPRIVVRESGGRVTHGVVDGVRTIGPMLVAWIWSADDTGRSQVWWNDVDVLAFSRDPVGADAFKWTGRVWFLTTDGWRAIQLEEGDPERVGDVVLRQVEIALWRDRRVPKWLPSAARVEAEVARISARYLVTDPMQKGAAA